MSRKVAYKRLKNGSQRETFSSKIQNQFSLTTQPPRKKWLDTTRIEIIDSDAIKSRNWQ